MDSKRGKRGKITAVPFQYPIPVNWLYIKFWPHLSIQRTVSKLLCCPQIVGNKLRLSWNKAIIYLVHISFWGERRQNTIRLLFVPRVIDVTPLEPLIMRLPQVEKESIKHFDLLVPFGFPRFSSSNAGSWRRGESPKAKEIYIAKVLWAMQSSVICPRRVMHKGKGNQREYE